MTIQQLEEMSQQYLTGSEERVMPSGYKQTDVGIIPLDWQSIHLGEIAEVKMCKRILSAQTSKTGPIPFFKIGTFGGESDAFISQSLYDEFKAKYSFPEMGDVLISAAGTLGKTVIYDGKPSYFQDSNIVWLKVDKTKILNEYLYHYFRVIKWASSEGSTISRLYNGIIRASLVSLPPLQEQIAIANALSDVDALINELEKLTTKKQAIKTATMQQLLTGRSRLPQFALREDGSKKGYKQSELGEIPEDWKVRSLLNIANLIHGKAHEPYVSESGRFVVVNSKFISTEGLVRKYCSQNDCVAKQGDVLMVLSDLPNGRALAKCYYVEQDHIYAVNQRVCIFRTDTFDSKFLYFYLNRHKYFLALDDGVTQTHILNGDIKDCQLYVPSNIEEQTAIAIILSDMDDELRVLEQRLNKTRQIKQGMMQELLTGKTRLIQPKKDECKHA